jgi:alpha-beta hydrolase superfamily lysophospholipase
MIEPRAEQFRASDGYPIHVLRWSPEAAEPTVRVAVLHGVQSHAGWYHNLGRRLAESGFEAFFPDRRGSGSNRKDRGHASSSRRLLKDVTEFLEHIRREEPARPTALAGISWGGKLAVLGAGTRPDLVDALALICPGLHPRVAVPLGERLAIALAVFTGRAAKATFTIPLSDPALFTDQEAGQRFIASDPLGLRVATAGLLASSVMIDRAVSGMARRVRQPALLMLSGQDRIVNNDRTRAYFGRLASPEKAVIEYPEGHHTLEFDPDPDRYARDLAEWLGRSLRPVANGPAGGRV